MTRLLSSDVLLCSDHFQPVVSQYCSYRTSEKSTLKILTTSRRGSGAILVCRSDHDHFRADCPMAMIVCCVSQLGFQTHKSHSEMVPKRDGYIYIHTTPGTDSLDLMDHNQSHTHPRSMLRSTKVCLNGPTAFEYEEWWESRRR